MHSTPASSDDENLPNESVLDGGDVVISSQITPKVSSQASTIVQEQSAATLQAHPNEPDTDEQPLKLESTLVQLAPPADTIEDDGSVLDGIDVTISSKITPKARERASTLVQEQVEANLHARVDGPDTMEEAVPLETKGTKDGEIVLRRTGASTLPMTIFNSINVLVGICFLALPLGIRDAGWVIGLVLFALAAIVTQYTSKLLAACLDTNTANGTYGDLAHEAFGKVGRNLVEVLFVLELVAANVALVILFADSLHSLLPVMSVIVWKTILVVVLMPLNFVPMKILSATSVLGIICCLGITLITLINGLLQYRSIGSLHHVAKTYAFPTDWTTLPSSFGLIMAPWAGQPIFPAIYKDMRHPQQYAHALRYTYAFTWSLDTTMAVLGYLMFGDLVLDEVTQNLLRSKDYPRALNILLVILIATIPVTKMPLTNRPIIDTLNRKFGTDLGQMSSKAKPASRRSIKHRSIRITIATLCNVVELAIAIAIPNFERVMALMGSALCFTICVILPVAFRLKIFKNLTLRERTLDWTLIVLSSILGILGVIWAIVPADTIHKIFHRHK